MSFCVRRSNMIGIITWFLISRFVVPISPQYHDRSMTVISSPPGSHPGSLLGFSLAYANKHLFISAPKDGSGIVYDYDILNNTYFTAISQPFEEDYTSWFGAVVKRGSTFLVTCAPRLWYENEHKTRGLCFKLMNNSLHPMEDIPEYLINNYSNSGLDTTGWSIEIDLNDFIFIGSPAISLGGIVKLYEYDEIPPWVLVNVIKSYNFGYAVASGKFLSENETYAISSTFGEYGEGMVIIVNIYRKELLRLSGDNVGGLYGAALCKVNLHETRSTLLVGSPTYSERSNGYDHGAVYVYVPNKGVEDMTLKRIITGQKDGGYFGFAIASLGDVDGDQRDEIAIGAPYEDDRKGAVYIYSGSGLLSGATWLQRIQPEKYVSFGYSLVPLNNCFDNGCNDLAVGAPFSDKAFILKCNNYITVRLKTVFPNLQNRSDETVFDFTTCVTVEYPKKHNINSNISIKVELNHPQASLKQKNGTFVFAIGSETLYCKNVTVLTPIGGDYDELIAYKISASLNDAFSNEYSRSSPLLSERSELQVQGEVWAANCRGNARKCRPQLTATLHSNISEPFIVGSSEASVSVSVVNSGEPAYAACARVLVLGAHVLRHPSTCKRLDNADEVTCKPSTPLLADDVWTIEDIQIDTDSLTSNDENIVIRYVTYDHCNNLDEKQEYERVLPLDYDTTGIVVKGTSNPSDLLNFTTEDASKKQRLEHVYMITDNGRTHWVGVNCEVRLEKSPYLNYSVSMMKRTTESCVIHEGDTDVTAICEVGDLKQNHVVNIIVAIEIHPNSLNYLIRTQNAKITTRLAVLLKDKKQVQSISTMLTLVSTSAPAWITFLAILLGLLLIFAIIYVLYKKNCFQRKNKRKLNNLKASLRHKDRSNEQDSHSDAQ